MDILIITTGLENAIRNVEDLAPELTWHEQKHGAAIWSAGNCLIGLWARTETSTQMEVKVFCPFKVGDVLKMQRDGAARASCDVLIARLRRVGLCQFYPDSARIADETMQLIRLNEKNNQAELWKLAGKTAEQAAAEYFARFESADTPTANQAAMGAVQPETSRAVSEPKAEQVSPFRAIASVASEGQTDAKPRKESKVKRIFGLRTEYLIAAIILGVIISVVSLFVFPDWARSNLTLVILFPFGFATATTIIANFRKAFE